MARQAGHRKKRVLEMYLKYGLITSACRAASVSRSLLYYWRKHDAVFRRDLEYTAEEVADDLEEEAIRRAKAGSDLLMIFLLKAYKPEKYRQRIVARHGPGDAVRNLQAIIDNKK